MRDRGKAESPTQLDRINDLVHDHWFDMKDVSFDSGARVLSVRFKRSSLVRTALGINPKMDLILAIHAVESHEIQDTQGIGRYDFNEITYDAARRQVTIHTGVPCVFRAVVSRLEVHLTEEDG